jgi:hypothetical protein
MSTLSQYGSGIKSIQRGTISSNFAATSATATISAVNPNKTMLNYLGATIANAAISLTNSTTITLSISYEFSANTSVSYEVIEFY